MTDDSAASAAFSSQLRQRARSGRVMTEEENPIVIAMQAHSAALASGSDAEITAAREKVDQLIADHHETQRPDFGAGARPQRQEPESMSTMLRRAAGYQN